MRVSLCAIALAGCHVLERNEIVRPGMRERQRSTQPPTARPPTIVVTDAGRLRFVEPLECATEEIVSQVSGTEIQTKPNLATFVVGVVASSLGAVATIRGLSDVDPGGSPFTYAGLALIGAGLPFAVGPWIGNHTELVPSGDHPAVRTPGPPEPCGERAVAARAATLHVRGMEIRGAIDREGVFSVSPYQMIDAFETVSVPTWEVTATIDTDKGLRTVTTQLDGSTFASHAKAFLATADFTTKIEPMRLISGVVAGTLRVSLTTSEGPAVRVVLPIKNEGPGPAWALRGHISAPGVPAIDGRVMYIGAMPKGEAREVTISIPVATETAGALRNTQIDVSVELVDAHGTAPTTPVRFRGPVLVDTTR